jgi:putative DNA primase/helicase
MADKKVIQIDNNIPFPSNNGVVSFDIPTADEIEEELTEPLWEDYFTLGELTLLAGVPGIAKSTILLSLAARITRGDAWPDGRGQFKQGHVLIYSVEDNFARTSKRRLRAMGADMKRIHYIRGKRVFDKPLPFDPAVDIPALTEELKRRAKGGGLSFLIMDPVINVIGKGDPNTATKVRNALQPVLDLAREMNCAVGGITHFRKNSKDIDPLDRLIHSGAFGHVPRHVLIAVRDNNTKQCMLVKEKVSDGPPGGGITYSVIPVDIQSPIDPQKKVKTIRIDWGGEVTGDSKDLIAQAEGTLHGEKQTQKNKARALLLEMLKDGPQLKSTILIEADTRHISEPALQRAKQELNIDDYRVHFQGPIWWKIKIGI